MFCPTCCYQVFDENFCGNCGTELIIFDYTAYDKSTDSIIEVREIG